MKRSDGEKLANWSAGAFLARLRWGKTTVEERREIMRKVARARWTKVRRTTESLAEATKELLPP